MTIALNILPIFLVIGIGLVAKKVGFLPREFLVPGNRLAFFIAIPAMLFRATKALVPEGGCGALEPSGCGPGEVSDASGE